MVPSRLWRRLTGCRTPWCRS